MQNLTASLAISVHLESGNEVVIIDGVAETVSDGALMGLAVSLYNEKYHWNVDPNNVLGPSYAVRPQIAFGCHFEESELNPESTVLGNATRWHFVWPEANTHISADLTAPLRVSSIIGAMEEPGYAHRVVFLLWAATLTRYLKRLNHSGEYGSRTTVLHAFLWLHHLRRDVYGVNIAGVVGTIVPLISKALGFDPALTSGPFETAFQDVVGISMFLGPATALIRFLL